MIRNARFLRCYLCGAIFLTAIAFPATLLGQDFNGFDSISLPAVSDSPGDWGLEIVVLNVGQADAILVITPNGDVALIDSGKSKAAGERIADFLHSKPLNSVGDLKSIDLLYSTHYDQDHIGGLPEPVDRGAHIRKAFDQGVSGKRSFTTATGRTSTYGKYVAAVGDPNGDLKQDNDESNFVRHKIHQGHVELVGLEDEVKIRCVAVRGDTEGESEDIPDLDPSLGDANFD